MNKSSAFSKLPIGQLTVMFLEGTRVSRKTLSYVERRNQLNAKKTLFIDILTKDVIDARRQRFDALKI